MESFFDIAYEIDFIGCPGSAIDGFTGHTSGTLHIETGEPYAPAIPAVSNLGLWILAGSLMLACAGYMAFGRRADAVRP